MTKRLHHISRMITPLLFLLVTAGGAAAADLWETAQDSEQPLPAVEGAVRGDEDRQVETVEQKGGFLGQSAVVTRNYGGRAYEYGYLHSSVTGGLFYKKLEKESNFDLEGSFLNENDYHGDLQYDYRGDYRFHLRAESLWHNLDRELLFTRPGSGPFRNYIPQQDPPTNYGVSAAQQSADFRYRLHNYPMHVNLGYWRYEKEGTIQQRFADVFLEARPDGTPNRFYAVSRNIHYQTQEGRVGADGHLGPVDLIYDFKIRVFKDRDDIPVSPYGAMPGTIAGDQQHNENPDSRFFSHTVKAHTSLAGGVVAAGSYTFEKRENLSRLTDTTGAKYISADVQTGAADFVYTPIAEITMAVKYRHQELDNDNRGTVTDINFVDPVQTVKPPIDTVKDLITATLTYKPRRDLSVTGQYRGDFLRRTDNVSPLPTANTWAVPDNTDTNKGSIAVHYRPVRGLRIDTGYTYATTDHPAYGNSYQQMHEGKFLTTYSRSNSWGGSMSAVIRREWNDEVRHYLVSGVDPLSYTLFPLTSRERKTENANIAGWYVPFTRLTLSANYAYVRAQVDQPVLFSPVGTGDEATSDFFSRSHVYGVGATFAAARNLDLSVNLQQVRSIAEFEPRNTVFVSPSTRTPGSDTSGVEDISRQDTVISFASVRGVYRFTPEVSSTLEYSFRDYNEKNPAYSAYNGTVHTVFAALSAKW